MEVSQGTGQYAVGRRLPSEGLAHDHEAVTHNHHLIDLLDLLQEEVSALKVHLDADFPAAEKAEVRGTLV